MPKKEKDRPAAKREAQSKADPGPRWTAEKLKCPEGDYEARLLLEWDVEGKSVLKGISCDNPRFAGLDNWDCKWSCWEKMKAAKK